MRDIDLTVKQLEQKYGKLDYIEKAGNLVDSSGRVRRINHTRANNDFMREMEAGILFQSLYDDFNLTLKGLEQKYGTLRLTPEDYYVDSKGIIRRILPYTPLTR